MASMQRVPQGNIALPGLICCAASEELHFLGSTTAIKAH